MMINLTKTLRNVVIAASLTMIPHAPLYAWGITSGTVRNSDVRQENNYSPARRNTLTELERERAYNILEKVDLTPFNTGTKLLKTIEYIGKRKIDSPGARGGLFDGSTTWEQQ